jgi:transcriptional regulator with XRE-family HTH domain
MSRTIGETALGTFLRDRRMRLDPTVLGFQVGRRRTPGLRREEVAQRANISPTWYTWLEQGRGGLPSADVLDRISRGLMLTEPERDHLHILAFGHPPEQRYRQPEGITPRLQRVLDAMPFSPAIIRTATWGVVAWNRAAALILTDYATLPKEERNILRRIFCDARVRAAQEDWRNVARYVVGAFRADAARAGAGVEIRQLVDELSASSPEFKAMWDDNEIITTRDGIKRLHHPKLGVLELEFTTLAVEGRSDLNMMVYNPATAEAMEQVRSLISTSFVPEKDA